MPDVTNGIDSKNVTADDALAQTELDDVAGGCASGQHFATEEVSIGSATGGAGAGKTSISWGGGVGDA